MSHPLLRYAASRADRGVAALVRLWSRTWRVEARGASRVAGARRGARGVAYCFAHGRMFELAALHADRGVAVLVSPHPDGRLAARVVRRLGYVAVVGSRSGGTVAGVRALLRHARRGGDLALTTDAPAAGSRPLLGAVALARLSGHALVPVAAAARPVGRIGSWDRFEIPWPGARVLVCYGDPIRVPGDAGPAEIESARRRLVSALAGLHRALENELGRRPERPARRASIARPADRPAIFRRA